MKSSTESARSGPAFRLVNMATGYVYHIYRAPARTAPAAAAQAAAVNLTCQARCSRRGPWSAGVAVQTEFGYVVIKDARNERAVPI
jgi:hypothetical protein